MKKAFSWSITGIGVLCLVFFLGLFVGRRTISAPVNPSAATDSTTQANAEEVNKRKININTANAALLQELPGIGEALASRIIAFREENGPFTDIRQLGLVDGISDGKLMDLIHLVCVEDAP